MLVRLSNLVTHKWKCLEIVKEGRFYFSGKFSKIIPTLKKEKSNVIFTHNIYPFLPFSDHPLIPGMNRIIPVSKQLLFKLSSIEKNNSPIVFSVIKEQAKNNILSISKIPTITKGDDVYNIGCICEISIDNNNTMTNKSNSLINTFTIKPIHLCKIFKFISLPNPIGKVKAFPIREKKIYQSTSLNGNLKAKFAALKELINRITITTGDINCKGYLLSIQQNFNLKCLNEVIYLGIANMCFPILFPQYSFMTIPKNTIQEIISIIDINLRLDKTIKVLGDLLTQLTTWENLMMQYDYSKSQTRTNERLKEIYLRLQSFFEQTKDEKKNQIEQIKNNLKGKKVPNEIMKIINAEINKYNLNDKYSMESNVIRNYLEVLSSLPFGISTKENLDIFKAKKVLDDTHYGMKDVKEKILENIAVSKLKGTSQGKILCFVGPPGVGKTSIGESIANALNRKYYRISLGGDRETSAIKGFRRTYVGAIPGKIIKALRTSGAENPVILLDEIDKLSDRNILGDPYSVLLEVLDPEQNHSFTDDYLDVPIDLSKVMFICTANSINNIPQALYDRMEIIEVSGYTFNEKKFIYERYLKPKAIERAGLTKCGDYIIEDAAVDKIINDYCRESGVRSLQRAVNRIFDKIALRKIQNDDKVIVNCNNIQSFLGPPTFGSNRLYHDEKLPKGVSIGLGFNNYGGSIIYIESNTSSFSNDKTKGELIITGNVGKVMNESCKIAMTYAKNFLNEKFGHDNKIKSFLDNNVVHIHFTEGAIPKDGPSAGVTICTSLISLALHQSIDSQLAMTGELTLPGSVLKIGGVKEKIMAAKREGIKRIILPFDNKEDFELLDANIKEGIEFFFVKKYEDIYNLCFNK